MLCMLTMAVSNVVAKNNYAIKVYNQSTYSKSKTTYRYYYLNDTLHSNGIRNTYTLFQPTIALNWTNKRQNVHEFEVTNFNFDTKDEYDQFHIGPTQLKSTSINIAVRYETIFSFLKKRNTLIKPQLGVAFSPFVEYYNGIPYVSSLYPVREMKFGLRHYAVPRCLIQISKKWHADINLPILIAKAQFISKDNHNPSVQSNEQRYSIFDFDMLERTYSLRLGISYNL